MMSLDYAELSSMYSATGTYTSSSTILGPGALSGRAIKKLGLVVINGLDSIIYRRRLAQIEKIMKDGMGSSSSADNQDSMQSIYGDLLELSRPAYSFPIRTRAFRLIMEKIGTVEIEELASAVVNQPLSEAYQHLSDVFACLWDSGSDTATIRNTPTQKRLATFRAAGLSAYMGLGQSSEVSREVLSTAFVTYISLLAALGDVQFSRMLVELNIVGFLSDLDLSACLMQDQVAVVCRLILYILQERLDPVNDSAAGISVSTLLASLLPPMDLEHTNVPSLASENDIEPLRPLNLLGAVHEIISSAKTPTRVSREMQASKQSEIKLLLLGSGESGKTTLLKQLMIAQPGQIDRSEYAEILVWDVLRALSKVIDHACEYGARWGKEMRPESYEDSRIWLERIDTRSESSDVLADLIQFVRKNVVKISCMRHTVLCDGTTDYFVDLLARICQEETLVPTEEDIIHSYVMTTGVYSELLSVQEHVYRVFDVGGQQSERKKWINCFNGASVVVTVASLSDYDQDLYEDSSDNRMEDALNICGSIFRTRWLHDVPMVLLLNKADVLATKLSSSPLEAHFSDYKGGADYAAACHYITKQFVSRRLLSKKNFYVYITCATDTVRTRELFDDIHQRVVQNKTLPHFKGLAYTSEEGFVGRGLAYSIPEKILVNL